MIRRPRISPWATAFAALTLILALGATPSQASFVANVSEITTQQAPALFLYTYTVTVSPTSTVGLAEFDLAVDSTDILTGISAPTGFTTYYTPGFSGLSFQSGDPSTDLAPGTTGIFSFLARATPTMVNQLLRGFDVSGNAVDNGGGLIAGPSTVPEPSSLLMCGLGAVGVCGLLARKRRQRTA